MPSPGIISGDQHIEAMQYGSPEREEDYKRAVTDSIRLAKLFNVRFFAALGDITNIKLEKRSSAKFLRDCFAQLDAAGIDIYTIRGNHDPEPIPMADLFGLPRLKDAEVETCRLLALGKSFQPYGEDGPRVCAVGYMPDDRLLERLREIRRLESAAGLAPSTELWLHGAFAPGAPAVAAGLHVDTFNALGWHTVAAADIHDGGNWPLERGQLYYASSKEMTDITEKPKKGEWLHDPANAETETDGSAWTFLEYKKGRPYHKFVFPDGLTDANVKALRDYAVSEFERTGLKPVIDVTLKDKQDKNLIRLPELRKLALRLHHRFEKTEKEKTERIDAGSPKSSIESRLLLVAEQRKLRPRTLKILQDELSPAA